jgi:hypothetical protein
MTCLRSVRFALPLSCPSTMSQPPSSSRVPAPLNQLRLQYATARRTVLDLHSSLEGVGDKESARRWLEAFTSAVVSTRSFPMFRE